MRLLRIVTDIFEIVIEHLAIPAISSWQDRFIDIVFDICKFFNISWSGAELGRRQTGLLLGDPGKFIETDDDLLQQFFKFTAVFTHASSENELVYIKSIIN